MATPGGRFAAQQVIDALQQFMHVDQLLRRRTSGTQHRVQQICEAIRLADDHARVFAQRRIQEFPLEQLRGAAQAAERIFDLMRELAHHQAASAQLRQQRVLASQAPMLRDVFDLQQEPQTLAAQNHLSHRAVEYAVDASRCRPRKLALHDAFSALAHAVEHQQLSSRRRASIQRSSGPAPDWSKAPAKSALRRSGT